MKRLLLPPFLALTLLSCSGGSNPGPGEEGKTIGSSSKEGSGESSSAGNGSGSDGNGEEGNGGSDGTDERGASSGSSGASGTNGSSGASGTTSEQHPECTAYGQTYCKCMGSSAAKDCVTKITKDCNAYWSWCYMRVNATCIVAKSCVAKVFSTCHAEAQSKCESDGGGGGGGGDDGD